MSGAYDSASSRTPVPGSDPATGKWVFATTHWSIVLSAQESASPAAAEALEKLCRAYWAPLYAFVRRSGHSPADAEDLTQGFFARLLEKGYLKTAAPEKGRFRSFLLMALKRFMANEWDRQHAGKRGGFAQIVAIDRDIGESLVAGGPADCHHAGCHHADGVQAQASPDVLYDRHWAQTLLARAMRALEEEYLMSGRAALLTHLLPCISRDETALPYAQIASRLDLTEPAVKMAVQRLRGRYREILRAEIAQTVSSAEEVEEEIRYLFSAFGG